MLQIECSKPRSIGAAECNAGIAFYNKCREEKLASTRLHVAHIKNLYDAISENPHTKQGYDIVVTYCMKLLENESTVKLKYREGVARMVACAWTWGRHPDHSVEYVLGMAPFTSDMLVTTSYKANEKTQTGDRVHENSPGSRKKPNEHTLTGTQSCKNSGEIRLGGYRNVSPKKSLEAPPPAKPPTGPKNGGKVKYRSPRRRRKRDQGLRHLGINFVAAKKADVEYFTGAQNPDGDPTRYPFFMKTFMKT